MSADKNPGTATRRDFLKGGAALAAGGVLGSAAMPASAQDAAPAARKPALTIAHLTDIHVKPEGKGPAGMRACLQHVQSRAEKPDLILQGGDSIMSVLGVDEDRARVQFDLWKQIMAEECRTPVRHCIGNHDCWGWQRSKAGTTGNEPRYGKTWVMEVHEMERPYYGFDQAGWRFLVLDSVQERGDGGYKPMLDDEQFEWLTGELEAAPAEQPVLILSHVPIIGVGALFFYDNIVENYQFRVAGALMHQDIHRLKDLLFKHREKVKVCLSGHVHLFDRVDYNGITFVCNGSVSGSWWYGTHKETEPGYGIVKLYDGGAFDYEYVTYPWDVEA